MPSVLHLAELEIALRNPFSNAVGAVRTRRVVLVGLEEDGQIGWGEAAPYPGISAESAGDVWGRAAAITDPAETTDLPTLDAALDQARFDLAARLAGVPLWQHLGGVSEPVPVSVALGLTDGQEEAARAAQQAVDAGFHRLKVKIAPERDVGHLAAVRAAAPTAAISADANGAYAIDDPLFDRLDELGLAYIEQPLAPRQLTEHAMLKERLDTPVCLDEAMHSPGSARDALTTGALDIACLKVGLLGPSACAGLAATVHRAGLGVKLGGLVETSVGRSHTLALGTLPTVDHADLTPATWFLVDDVADAGWSIEDGAIAPSARPGIGFELDAVQMAGLIERTQTVSLRTG